MDQTSLSRETARRDWSEQTSGGGPGVEAVFFIGLAPSFLAARHSQNGARRPCFRIAMNQTDGKRLLAVYLQFGGKRWRVIPGGDSFVKVAGI